MRVAAFRINTGDMKVYQKLEGLDLISRKVLSKDKIWHFFLDPDAITLRCDIKYADKLEKFLQDTHKSKRKYRVKDFEPSKHEYQFIRFVGDELQEIFHATSLMALKYPRHVMRYQILERINHIIVNQMGQHDFKAEAEMYIDAAYQRVTLQGKFLGLPKWLHKFIVKRLFL